MNKTNKSFKKKMNSLRAEPAPHERLSQPPQSVGLWLWLFSGIFIMLGALYVHKKFGQALYLGFHWGFWIAIVYWLWPIIFFVLGTIYYGRFPSRHYLDSFSPSQKVISCLVLAWILMGALDLGLPYVLHAWKLENPGFHYHIYHGMFHDRHYPEYFDKTQFFIAWIFMALGLGIFFGTWLHTRSSYIPATKKPSQKPLKKTSQNTFNLWIGKSTGWLSELHHSVGIVANQEVILDLEDAAQNILILGGIGSGKTTRAVHPLLLQCLNQNAGGLIFDIKGDFKRAVFTLAEKAKRTIVTIGVGQTSINLLQGLAPEIAASFLKSVFILNTKTQTDGFWVDTATELCRNFLGILSFFPESYSLNGLYKAIFIPTFKDELKIKIERLLPELNDKEGRLLQSYQAYETIIYANFEEKVKSNVNATIAQVLSPFNHPELIDAFCTEREHQANLQAMLERQVFLIDMPLALWGLGAKVVYSFIKLKFYNLMQSRRQKPHWNQENPVFFLCDEFQEIVSANRDGLSDLNFWDKSRSSYTIGIISAQSVSSFYAAIGDRDVANALLQNFRQKICFKTEDQTTLDSLNRLLGQIETERYSYSNQQGTQSNPQQFFDSSSQSSSKSLTLVTKPLLDAQLMRQLGPSQAIALLCIQGVYRDDVLNMMPIFI